MKIAIVYDAIYPDHIGGAEKRNWEVARRLARRGHEVWLVGMQYWSGEAVICRDGVICAGVCPAVPLFNRRGGRSLIEPLYFAYHLLCFFRHHRFDLVNCGEMPYLSCLVAKLFCRRQGVPLVITWHEVRGLQGWRQYSGALGILAWLFETITTRLASHNMAISALTVDRAVLVYPVLARTMRLIECGVDSSVQPLPGQETRLSHRLLYVGRLVPHKRVEWLIAAVRNLAPDYPELRLIIVGKGSEESRLKGLVEEWGLSRQVEFKGVLAAGELEREMAGAGMLVFPSEQEGFGVVIIEAMAAGLPVIAADAPFSAARSIINSGRDGILVQTEAEMIAGIQALLTDRQLYERLVEQGRITARRYDWDTIIMPAIESYFEEALKDKRGTRSDQAVDLQHVD